MSYTPRVSPSTRKKEELTKETLESHSIFFVENVCKEGIFKIPDNARKLYSFLGRQDGQIWSPYGVLPQHVYDVGQYLLQFEQFVPAVNHDECGVIEHLQEHFPTALNRGWAKRRSIEEIKVLEQRHRDVLKDHCKVANEALQLQYESDESCWQHFLDRELFCDPRRSIIWHSYEGSEPGPRHLTRAMNRIWGASKEVRKLDDREPIWPSKPKPDFAFGFRVWISRSHITQDGSVKIVQANSSLSYQVLGELSRNCQLHAMPMKRKDNQDGRSNYLLAFPFAIVEVKKSNSNPSEGKMCCLQAANAASTSLKIFEKLWNIAEHIGDVAPDTGEIARDADLIPPPVVSFTCVGPILRLWLSYSMTGRDTRVGHIMVPIWEGDLSTIYGIIQARRIYERLIQWVLDCLRPRLSKLIKKIRDNIAGSDSGYETLENGDLLSEYGGDIFRLFDPDTPKQKTPKRPETPRSMTTPGSARSAKTEYSNLGPVDRPRAKSAEPTTPSRTFQSTFATPATSTRTTSPSPCPCPCPCPMSSKLDRRENSSHGQPTGAEIEELADQFSEMKLGKYGAARFMARLRPNIAAKDNRVKHVGDSESDDEYYDAKESFEGFENEASVDTPTKNARSR